MSPQTRWNEIIVLSTIGRKPTIVPVRGKALEGGQRAVAGAEGEDELVARRYSPRRLRRLASIDARLGRPDLIEALGERLKVAVDDGGHRGCISLSVRLADERVERDFEQLGARLRPTAPP